MKRLTCLLLALCLLLGACGEGQEMTQPPQTEAEPETTEYMPPVLEVLPHREGELVFSLTATEFIALFNGVWGGEYLTPVEEWKSFVLERGIHAPHETLCRQFSENEKVWSLPTITIYTPPDSDRIQQITVNFDEHSRTEELYGLYEELCRTAAEVFLPESDVEELCRSVIELAYENVFENEDGYSADSRIPVLYYSGGVGVYPYFALGEWVHFVIIPVDKDCLAVLRDAGTEIIEIE